MHLKQSAHVNTKDGKDGKTPAKGKDYFDGYTPVKGKDYRDGKDGKDGTDGETGISPVELLGIMNRLAKLEGK